MSAITLRYFAELRDQVGCDSEQLQLDSPQTIADVRQMLVAREGGWVRLQDSLRYRSALNHHMAAEDAIVRPGDELAFFPPVTGG